MFIDDFALSPSLSVEEAGDICNLKDSGFPCLVWGAGEVATKVIKYLKENGIFPVGIWVDKEGGAESFLGIPVMNVEDIRERFSKINLVLGHNRYDYISEVNRKYDFIERVYAFTGFFGWDEPFDRSFAEQKEKQIKEAYDLAEDEISRLAYVEYIYSRIDANPFYISTECILNRYFDNTIIAAGNNETLMDIGACKGNMLRTFVNEVDGIYNGVIALEPEDGNYRELQNYCENNLHNAYVQKIGCWKEKTVLKFLIDGTGRSNHIADEGSGTISIEVDKIDNIVKDDMPLTICNLFFQSGENEVLEGAQRVLRDRKPKLIVGIGMRKEQCYEIPLLIKRLNPDYRIYYRFTGALPSVFFVLAV